MEKLKNRMNIKVADCFIFYNELDMLEFRLEYLKDVVDYFVIVEATKTFVGKEKTLYFRDNKSRFVKYLHRIIHVVVSDLHDFSEESPVGWANEEMHRNSISKGISKISLDPSDIVLISDVDEIPDSDTILNIKKIGISGIHSLVQDLYYYNLGFKISKWNFAKALDFDTYKQWGARPHSIRIAHFDGIGIEIEKGGWHFSYFGTANFIKNKIESFSHQEYNREDIKDSIIYKIENGENLFDDRKFEFLEPSENPYLPDGYEKIIDFFGIPKL
jgi:hypothetical protein